MKFERRPAFGWPSCKAATATPTKGLVAHYNGPATGLLGKAHSACHAYWKNTRNYHVDTKGWADIGYSFGVCPHGYVLEGRGRGFSQAAQGTTAGNREWYSCTFMLGTGERPTALQVDAWHDLRMWLTEHGVSRGVRGHSDFFSTDCPGSILSAMINDGTLTNDRSTAVGAFKDVWQTDAITAPPWEIEKGNPTWMASTYLTNLYVKVSEMHTLFKELAPMIRELHDVLTLSKDAVKGSATETGPNPVP